MYTYVHGLDISGFVKAYCKQGLIPLSRNNDGKVEYVYKVEQTNT